MKVELKRAWFAPTEVTKLDKLRSTSGMRVRQGTHDLDDSLFDALPSDALVDGVPVREMRKAGVRPGAAVAGDPIPVPKPHTEKPAEDEGNPLHDADPERAASDAEVAIREKAAAFQAQLEAEAAEQRRKPGRPKK